MTKIVCIGAGSFSFGLSTLVGLLKSESLVETEIALVDTNPQALELMTNLAEWLNTEWDCGKRITSHSHHQQALPGADFVISSLEVQPREQLWQQDFEITNRYGIRQPYAENGGPGGFGHAARNVNTVLGIARDMEAISPNAWFINFTNPMHRLCYLVDKYSSIKVVGLCHQLSAGYAMVGKALANDYGFDGADDFISTHADPLNHFPMAHVAEQAQARFQILAAGLNHFTWMLGLRDRQTGEDLLPLFHDRWAKLDPGFEPLTRELYGIYKTFPIPGDEHLCEYLPWMSDPTAKPWEKYDLSLYNWELMAAIRDFQWEHVSDLIRARNNTEMFEDPASEGAVEIIEAIATDSGLYWEAVNVPNQGAIEGLSSETIVEVPAVVGKDGIHARHIGAMPQGVLALLQAEAHSAQLCIDAVVQGDRDLALQALLSDPVITDIGQARKVLNDILVAYMDYLPQFWD